METNELETLIEAKKLLSNVPFNRQSVDYINICFEIDSILYRRCNHKICFDSIDIDVERSENICYCENCYLTFTVEFFRDFLLFCLDENKRDQWKVITNEGIYDLYDIYVLRNQLCFQLELKSNYNETRKYSLHEIIGCRADECIVYLNP